MVFLASFHNNDATLSQFHVLNMLCESFVESMTVVLPYYPTGTMERVLREGQVATASTLARLFSNLPRVGKPVRRLLRALDLGCRVSSRAGKGLDVTPRQDRMRAKSFVCGWQVRVMVYDLHTLQNRFYLSGNALATLHTAIPLLISYLKSPESKINCIAFPDEGACKR